MRFRPKLAAALALLFPVSPVAADTITLLSWIPGTSIKIEQIIGDYDWQFPQLPTASLTVAHADVLGNGLGHSFTSGDSLIFLFGDTIGATSKYVPRWASILNPYVWAAHDPIASSHSTDPSQPIVLSFYKTPGDTTVFVDPVYPDGTHLDMGGDDIPNSGIDLDSNLDLICSVGTVNGDHTGDSSVVVRFDPAARTFAAGRTMSRTAEGGHFVFDCPYPLPMQFAGSPSDSEVLIYGIGSFRQSDVYLAMIKKKLFESGVHLNGTSATRYFTGLSGGVPTWSDTETAAVPVVYDNPLQEIGIGEPQNPWPNDDPTVGKASVIYSPAVGLWLMLFDGGRQATASVRTAGTYFTYANAPWGPWMEPQLVFNSKRDGADGTYIYKYDHVTGTGTGPAGPMIGSNDPDTTSGAGFFPQIIEPFTRVSGDTLIIEYSLSTWNPYTVVRVRSEFLMTPNQILSAPAPRSVALGVRPNPFTLATRVTFALAHGEPVDIAVYDVEGRRLKTLAHGPVGTGARTFTWDGTTDAGTEVRPGIYLVGLRAPGTSETRRVVRLR